MEKVNLSLEEIIRRQHESNSLNRSVDAQEENNCSLSLMDHNDYRRRNVTNRSNMGVKNSWKNGHHRQNVQNKPRKRWLSNSTLRLYDGGSNIANFIGPPRASSVAGSAYGRGSVASFHSRGSRQSMGSLNSRASYFNFGPRRSLGSSMSYHSDESLQTLQYENNSNKFFVRLDSTIQSHINLMKSSLEDRIASLSCPSLASDPGKCRPTSNMTNYSMHDRFSRFIINRRV